MPFYLYRSPGAAHEQYERLRTVSLAGYNAIHRGWKEQGEPIEQGWHMNQQDLIRLVGGDEATNLLIIDLKPSSKRSIDLYELLDIWVYTHGDPEGGRVDWNPLMLRLREFWCEQCSIEGSRREAAIKRFRAPLRASQEDIFEFLYLQGSNWNWGRSGQVNGVLLYEEARTYFLQVLCTVS